MKTMSKRNPYYLPIERRLELKYFCMQYPRWEAEYNGCIIVPGAATPEKVRVDENRNDSMVEITVERREGLKTKMDMVIETSKQCDKDFGKYIFRGVTTGLSYDQLWKRMTLPLSKSSYYMVMEKFFWMLDKERN